MERRQPAVDPVMARRLERLAAEGVRECFQCAKCSAGCPVAPIADLLPHEAVQALQLGRAGSCASRTRAGRAVVPCRSCANCRYAGIIEQKHVVDSAGEMVADQRKR